MLLNGGTFQSNGIANLDFTNDFSVTTSGGILDARHRPDALGTFPTWRRRLRNGYQAPVASGTVVLTGTKTGYQRHAERDQRHGAGRNRFGWLRRGAAERRHFQLDGLSSLTFTNNFLVAAVGGGVDNNGTVLTLSGVIADVGGPGVLDIHRIPPVEPAPRLSGVNTYSGGTNVIGGRVQVTNASSIGSGAVTLDNGVFQAGAAGPDLLQ